MKTNRSLKFCSRVVPSALIYETLTEFRMARGIIRHHRNGPLQQTHSLVLMAGIALQDGERSVGEREILMTSLLVGNSKPVVSFRAGAVVFHLGDQAQISLCLGIVRLDRKRLMKRLRRSLITIHTVQNPTQVIPGIHIFAVHTDCYPEPFLRVRLVVQQHIIASNHAQLFAVRLP